MSKLNLISAYKLEIIRISDKYSEIDLVNKAESELKLILDRIVLGKIKL